MIRCLQRVPLSAANLLIRNTMLSLSTNIPSPEGSDDLRNAFKYVFHRPKRPARSHKKPLNIITEEPIYSASTDRSDSIIELQNGSLPRYSSVDAQFSEALREAETPEAVQSVVSSISGYLSPSMLMDTLQKLTRFMQRDPSLSASWYFGAENFGLRQAIEHGLEMQSYRLPDNGLSKVVRFLLLAYRLNDDSASDDYELLNREFPQELAGRIRRLPLSQLISCCALFNKSSPLPAHPIGQLVLRSILDQIYEQFELRMLEVNSLDQCERLLEVLDVRSGKLLNKLDDHILNILTTQQCPREEIISLLCCYAASKRRSRPVISACLYLIQNDPRPLNMEDIKHCLNAAAKLQIFDEIFTGRLLNGLRAELEVRDLDEDTVYSLSNSLGRLRLRDEAIYDRLWQAAAASQNFDCIKSALISCAVVNYVPSCFCDRPDILAWSSPHDRINILWALACLDIAEKSDFEEVINRELFQELSSDSNTEEFMKFPSVLKLLQLHHYYQYRFLNPEDIQNDEFPLKIEDLSGLITLRNKQMIGEVKSILENTGHQDELFKSLIVTKSGLVIDFLLVVNQDGEPQNLQFYIQRSSGHKNKMIIPNFLSKIALKCVDFHDRTWCSITYTGPTVFYKRMIELQGYKCIFIDGSVLASLSSNEEKEAFIWSLIRQGDGFEQQTTIENGP